MGLANAYSHMKMDSAACCGSSIRENEQFNSGLARMNKNDSAIIFKIEGMSCMSCVNKIEKVLKNHAGVSRVAVDLPKGQATVRYDSEAAELSDLKAALESLGYGVLESKTGTETDFGKPARPVDVGMIGPYPYLFGIAAAIAVVGFYLGLLTLTSDWYNAKAQFGEFRWWIIALSLGLGLQVTLYSFMRKGLRNRNIRAAKSGLAASGGMSTASMAACCAHYLVPLAAAIGLPFLSAAAAGIANYQTELFFAGVLSNLFGLGIMLRLMQKNGVLNFEHAAYKGGAR